ncbi:MAG: WYL domain-containing protein, partial [Actinomycetota bacterium]
ALYLRGRAALEMGGPVETRALRSALDKLEHELGDETISGLADLVETGDGAEGGADRQVWAELRDAVERHERVEIEYYTASRDEVTIRTVEPERMFSQFGSWYVIAWDDAADDVRTFRVDRVHEARRLGATFEPRGLDEPIVAPPQGPYEVTLQLSPDARWVAEYYDADTEATDDGRLLVTLRVAQLAWAAKLLLRLGPQAEVVVPAELRSLLAEQASAALVNYAGNSPETRSSALRTPPIQGAR